MSIRERSSERVEELKAPQICIHRPSDIVVNQKRYGKCLRTSKRESSRGQLHLLTNRTEGLDTTRSGLTAVAYAEFAKGCGRRPGFARNHSRTRE